MRWGRCGGNLCGDRDMWKWLAERISWLGKRYEDSKTHENGLEKTFLCRSVCIVIPSL